MRNDPGPFIASALTGLCSSKRALTASHEPGHVSAEQIAARALEIGKAAASAYAAEMEARMAVGSEEPSIKKGPRG